MHIPINRKQPQELKVRAGEWDTQTKNEIYPHQDRDVEKVVVHERFHSGALYNDYAILILKTPVEYAENVDIICLAEINANFDGSRCFASGWGKDIFGTFCLEYAKEINIDRISQQYISNLI